MTTQSTPASSIQPTQPTQPSKRKKAAIIWERVYPSAIGVLVTASAAVARWRYPEWKLPNDLGQLFSSTMDIGAIAIGFLATAKTVLLSIQGSPAVTKMRGSGLYEGLLRFILKAIRAAFALATWSLVTVFLEKALNHSTLVWELVVFAWLFLVITAGLSCYRVIDVFFILLSPRDISTLVPTEHHHPSTPAAVIAPPRKEPNQGNNPP
ncbi:hypothetical protein [Pyxidicoccus trucidator]|uniref:hypothetical protein n=1 Tax=Pyxidicoccus trucidator TaxID=2709662 RepID=UPI0013D9F45B|nr:hypothetical protein [Pyxidicoccus trucidator]